MNDWMCEKSQPKGHWIWVWSTSWNTAINATWSICTFLNATISTLSTRGKWGLMAPKRGFKMQTAWPTTLSLRSVWGFTLRSVKNGKYPFLGNLIQYLTWLEDRPKHFVEWCLAQRKRESLSIDEITIVVFPVWMQAAPGARCIPRGFEKQPSSF